MSAAAWICLLGASPLGARAVTAAGYELVVMVTAGAPVPAEVSVHATEVAVADITRTGAARGAIAALTARRGRPALIVSFTELGLATAAELSADLGLASVSVEAVRATRDKHLMRQALTGTPWAWPHHAGPAEQVAAWLSRQEPGSAWIVKPVDGSGSTGIHLVHAPATEAAWTRQGGQWIAERAAHGPEFSLEAVSSGGEHRLLAVTAKHTTGPAGFVEIGHVVPAAVATADAAAMWGATCGVLDAVGVRDGASHTEIRLDPRHGPVVIESHTRPGGDCIPELVALTTGHDQYQLAVGALLGQPPTATTPRTPAAAIRFVLPPLPGRITGIHAGQAALEHPGLRRLCLDAAPGDAVTGVGSSDDRIGYVIATGRDPHDAEQAAAAAAADITVTVSGRPTCS